MLRLLFALFVQSRSQLRLTWRLLNDNRVPMWQKAVPLLPVLYIISPINLLTFAIPIVGQIDDVALFLMAMRLFETLVDDRILSDYKRNQEQ